MPLSAAATVCTAFDTESSNWLRSLARLLRPWAVKKLVGLSRAEFTRRPVDRRSCDLPRSSAVLCRLSRLERTALERVISDIWCAFLGSLVACPHPENNGYGLR